MTVAVLLVLNVVPVCAVLPDFAQVYKFIGSVFDPDSTCHLERLKQMDPINLETVCYFRILLTFINFNFLISQFRLS